MSARGIGHSWTTLTARDAPVLFGGGGWQDAGQVGLIVSGSVKNTQRVESVAIQDGMGERALDVPDERMAVESTANANDEFDNSQFKTGLNDETAGRVQLTTTQDGIAAGDTLMKVDPRADVFDQTLSALGDIHGHIHNTKEDVDMDASGKPVNDGVNPFGTRKHVDVTDDSGREYKQATEEYMYAGAKPSLSAQQQSHVNANAQTGLRRVNIKKNTGTLMERAASKQAMMQSYQQFTESISEEMGQHNKGHVNFEDRDKLLQPTRFEGADMVATQLGVQNLSNSQAMKHHRSKHTSKLSSAVVGS
jgi:hypothetical protein